MDRTQDLDRRPRVDLFTWLTSFGLATVLGLVVALQGWLGYHGPNKFSFWDARVIQPQLIPWYVWATFAPGLLLLLDRTRPASRTPGQRIATYVALAGAAILFHALVAGIAIGWWWSFPSPAPLDPGWHIVDQLRTHTGLSLLVFAFVVAVYHARRQIDLPPAPSPAPSGVRTAAVSVAPLALRVADRIVFVRPQEIDWIQADGDYVIVHVGTVRHRIRETITRMEAKVPPAKLIRVSRSAIVNIDAVRELQPWFRGNFVIVIRNGARVTTGAQFRARLLRLL